MRPGVPCASMSHGRRSRPTQLLAYSPGSGKSGVSSVAPFEAMGTKG